MTLNEQGIGKTVITSSSNIRQYKEIEIKPNANIGKVYNSLIHNVIKLTEKV